MRAMEPRKTKSIEQANELKWTDKQVSYSKNCTLVLKNEPKIYQFIQWTPILSLRTLNDMEADYYL